MLRAARYCDRPAQADQLHLDLWWRGENIACDAGTYLYNGLEPWTNSLAATAVHNTVTVGGREQMTRAGRFLWTDWAQAESVGYRVATDAEAVEACHDGYRTFGTTHKRGVLSIQSLDCWIVIDDVVGTSSASTRLHWLLPDFEFAWEQDKHRLRVQTPAGPFQCCLRLPPESSVSLARCGQLLAGSAGSDMKDEVRSWRSLYYGEKIPALSLAAESRVPNRFVTVLGPADVLVADLSQAGVRLSSNRHECVVNFRVLGSERMFSEVSFSPRRHGDTERTR